MGIPKPTLESLRQKLNNWQHQENGKSTYYLDTRFIVGCFDVDTQTVRLNKAFERTLSQRTIKQLHEGYSKIVTKTKKELNHHLFFLV